MRRIVLNAAALFTAVTLVIGCNNKPKPAEIPSKLDQPLPKLAAPAGGGGDPAAKKEKPPNTKAD